MIPTIFIALEPPTYTLDKKGNADFVAFRISLDQVKPIAPLIYQRLIEQEKQFAAVVCVHADDSGNIFEEGNEAIRKFKPDMIFCCHTADVRRIRPELPVVGWYDGQLFMQADKDSLIVKIEEV